MDRDRQGREHRCRLNAALPGVNRTGSSGVLSGEGISTPASSIVAGRLESRGLDATSLLDAFETENVCPAADWTSRQRAGNERRPEAQFSDPCLAMVSGDRYIWRWYRQMQWREPIRTRSGL